MKSDIRKAMVAIMLTCLMPLRAADAQRPEKGSGSQGAAQQPVGASSSTGQVLTSDEELKNQILHSERWRNAIYTLNDYLQVQKRFSKDQIREMIARLKTRVDKMSASELEHLLQEMESKLTVLLSPQADEARRWLGVYMSNMADGYREEFLKTIPDPTKLSADELERALESLPAKQASIERRQEAFNAGRKEQVQSAEAMIRASQQSSQRAANRVAASAPQSSVRSPYTPQVRQDPVRQGPRFTIGFPGGGGSKIFTPLNW